MHPLKTSLHVTLKWKWITTKIPENIGNTDSYRIYIKKSLSLKIEFQKYSSASPEDISLVNIEFAMKVLLILFLISKETNSHIFVIIT